MKRTINRFIVLNEIFILLIIIFLFKFNTFDVYDDELVVYKLSIQAKWVLMIGCLLLVFLCLYAVLLYHTYMQKLRYTAIGYIHVFAWMLQTYVVVRVVHIFWSLDTFIIQYHFMQNYWLFLIVSSIAFILHLIVLLYKNKTIKVDKKHAKLMIIYTISLAISTVLACMPLQKPTIDLEKTIKVYVDEYKNNGYSSLYPSISQITKDSPLYNLDHDIIHQFTIDSLDANQKQGSIKNGNVHYQIGYNPYLDTIFNIKNKDKQYIYNVSGLRTYIQDVDAILPIYPNLRSHADMLVNELLSTYHSYTFLGSYYSLNQGKSYVSFYYLIRKDVTSNSKYFLYESSIPCHEEAIKELAFSANIDVNTNSDQIDFYETKETVINKYITTRNDKSWQKTMLE